MPGRCGCSTIDPDRAHAPLKLEAVPSGGERFPPSLRVPAHRRVALDVERYPA